ncbi:putative short-chain dehydrogenase/reductase SDR, NAD(P)-binding domain superfamily [Septoria linicola]|nr:putative short-chain dehydrogenase/reductase SDR, NAD(P)-binding domain superfamily [Septoria linicola]
MSFKILDFKCALVTGGAGGIGRAMTEYFLSLNKKVIIAGRTESKLKSTAQEINNSNLSYYVLDTGDLASIPAFIKKLTSEHPDLDCLVNNAGVQRPLDVNEMSPKDFLEKADQEVSININGPMHLAIGLLPHFKSHKSGAVIINVSSVLGYIPTSVINPVYNGTKAWQHFWSVNLRTQLSRAKDGGEKIRVVEIAPPTVATDLHREREDPNDNKKENNDAALSVEEFMDELTSGLKRDDEVISAGWGKGPVEKWYKTYAEDYKKAAGDQGGRGFA